MKSLKVVLFIVWTVGLIFVAKIWGVVAQPEITADLALEQLENPSVGISSAQRWLSSSQGLLGVVWLLGFLGLFWRELKKGFTVMFKALIASSIVAMLILSSGGCRKPYHEPVLVDLDTSETPFLIEL